MSDYYINGTKLSATSDHRIMTTNGWKQIGELGKDTLFKISMEKDFTNTPENVIIREELANYTELFENIIMGRFRREMKYITSTGTPKTMRSPIYNVSPKKTIKAYTKLRYKRGENQRNNLSISHKSENLHLNGILPKKGGNGIQKTLKALEKRISCVLVRTALKDFIQLIEIPNTAVELVKQPITDITKSNTRMENVYNLQIAVNHKYFANGFLVSNCLDSLRYAIWTKFSNISNGHYALK